MDELGITASINKDRWESLRIKDDLFSPSQAIQDESWAEAFLWLIDADKLKDSIGEATIRFINGHRHEYQHPCTTDHTVLFLRYSDVNDWSVFWGDDHSINYLAYSQG